MNYLRKYNLVNGDGSLKALRIKARLKHKAILKARAEQTGLYMDTFNYLYTKAEYLEIQENYRKQGNILVFRMSKIL